MACPFFFPTERSFTIAWSFPQRLPLGTGFCGTCRASSAVAIPDEATLRDLCNVGYAGAGCRRLPVERRADSVRFAVAEDTDDRILLAYVYDREHAPVEHGRLEYNCRLGRWISSLNDECGQRQAECFLGVYLERKPRKD